jgi:hypothetical protein
MRSLGLLSLLVVLAIGYLLYSHSAAPGQDGGSAQTQNTDVYKADMDRAHAAAQMMAKSRKESDAY